MSQKAAMRRRRQFRNGFAQIAANKRPGFKRAGGTIAASIVKERVKAARMAAANGKKK